MLICLPKEAKNLPSVPIMPASQDHGCAGLAKNGQEEGTRRVDRGGGGVQDLDETAPKLSRVSKPL